MLVVTHRSNTPSGQSSFPDNINKHYSSPTTAVVVVCCPHQGELPYTATPAMTFVASRAPVEAASLRPPWLQKARAARGQKYKVAKTELCPSCCPHSISWSTARLLLGQQWRKLLAYQIIRGVSFVARIIFASEYSREYKIQNLKFSPRLASRSKILNSLIMRGIIASAQQDTRQARGSHTQPLTYRSPRHHGGQCCCRCSSG